MSESKKGILETMKRDMTSLLRTAIEEYNKENRNALGKAQQDYLMSRCESAFNTMLKDPTNTTLFRKEYNSISLLVDAVRSKDPKQLSEAQERFAEDMPKPGPIDEAKLGGGSTPTSS